MLLIKVVKPEKKYDEKGGQYADGTKYKAEDMLDTLSKKYDTLKSEAKESYADGKEPVQNSIDQGNF